MTDHDTEPALQPLPETGVRRVLCVVAHPDDMEYGTSAAVAAWTARGVAVTYLLLTHGEAGMADPPEDIGPLRAREQSAACAQVGVEDLRMLDHPDGTLEHGLELRADVARVIREVRPDLVLTTPYDIEAFGGLNQADHRAAGLAAVDAVRDAANPWVFPEQLTDGLRPWQASALLIAAHAEPTHGLPVGPEQVQASIASLSAHAAYLDHVSGHPAPAEFIPSMLSAGGHRLGVEHAVLFRVFDLGGLPGGE